MDAQAKKKELFRAKLREQQQKKRIDSDLVRYNQFDQPVCRVCDVLLKSDALWPAHAASRKHHEAIANLRANASRQKQVNDTKTEPNKKLARDKADDCRELLDINGGTELKKSRPSNVLPADFFDSRESKRQKADSSAPPPSDSASSLMVSGLSQSPVSMEHEGMTVQSSDAVAISGERESRPAGKLPTDNASRSQSVQIKGALPEGFFDNKEADLRARGIQPVKIDVKDEYKEFEKSIQEDLQEVDKRFEEEEFDAAETIEEEETIEQKTCRERVEVLKRKKIELLAARSSKPQGNSKTSEEAAKDESSSDDSDESFTVDWRAQHL